MVGFRVQLTYDNDKIVFRDAPERVRPNEKFHVDFKIKLTGETLRYAVKCFPKVGDLDQFKDYFSESNLERD